MDKHVLRLSKSKHFFVQFVLKITKGTSTGHMRASNFSQIYTSHSIQFDFGYEIDILSWLVPKKIQQIISKTPTCNLAINLVDIEALLTHSWNASKNI